MRNVEQWVLVYNFGCFDVFDGWKRCLSDKKGPLLIQCQLILIFVSFQGLNLGNEHLPRKGAALSQCKSSGPKDDLQADRLVKI